ncbi:S-adenosyl-L-methionine-dependent methyltransferase [Gracilaria domingensis]|nr:S-adenosyl-L-methionine-dependent methyltransferase [Gracilaria domingensis]
MGGDSPSDRYTNIAAAGLTTIACTTAVLGLITAPFLRTFSGAPYVTSSNLARHTIRRFLREEALKRTKIREAPLRLVDLGAGSGDLVLDAAEEGWIAKGAELNIWLVLTANWRSWRRGLLARASVEWRDMWTTKVSEFDVVTVFGVPSIMERVGAKVLEEANTGCVVCCNGFEIPGWKGRRAGDVWFYEVSDQRLHVNGTTYSKRERNRS